MENNILVMLEVNNICKTEKQPLKKHAGSAENLHKTMMSTCVLGLGFCVINFTLLSFLATFSFLLRKLLIVRLRLSGHPPIQLYV